MGGLAGASSWHRHATAPGSGGACRCSNLVGLEARWPPKRPHSPNLVTSRLRALWRHVPWRSGAAAACDSAERRDGLAQPSGATGRSHHRLGRGARRRRWWRLGLAVPVAAAASPALRMRWRVFAQHGGAYRLALSAFRRPAPLCMPLMCRNWFWFCAPLLSCVGADAGDV